MHRHRRLWPEPDRFDPDRFCPEQTRAHLRYAYIQFGVGPHVCPGAALAMNEILITVAILARRVRFRLAPGPKIEPTAWTTLRPKNGLMVTIEKR